jgi:CHAD domain-containing protein
MMVPQAIHFRMTRDPRSSVPIPTPASIHKVRQASRGTLARLTTLRHALGRGSFSRLRKSLRDLIDLTAQSRDAQVQRMIISRLKAGDAKNMARECNRLLNQLKSRERVAAAQLAEYLCSDIGSERTRRMSEDLSLLQLAQSRADLPRLAAQRYRRALQDIEELLAHKVTMERRVHPLRIRMREARDLACMSNGALGVGAEHLNHKINKMQEALGELHDLMLLAVWIKKRRITVMPRLRVAFDTLEKHCLSRCKCERKPLRHAIRRFLRKTRR